MQTSFQRASFKLPPDEIISGQKPPFAGYSPPDFLQDFYDKLVAHETAQNRVITGGFVFGGMFSDMQVGRAPKDYDIYISSESLIDAMQAMSDASRDSLKSWRNRDENLATLFEYTFPLDIQNQTLAPVENAVLGTCVTINSLYETPDGIKNIDLVIGRKKLHISQFLPFTSAPIMAAGMMLDGSTPRYAYHKDFERHAEQGLLVTDRPTDQLITKSRVKNWAILPRSAGRLLAP